MGSDAERDRRVCCDYSSEAMTGRGLFVSAQTIAARRKARYEVALANGERKHDEDTSGFGLRGFGSVWSGATDATKRARRSSLERFAREHGDKRVALLCHRHVRGHGRVDVGHARGRARLPGISYDVDEFRRRERRQRG